MEIALGAALILFGIAITSSIYNRKWLLAVIRERDRCYSISEQQRKNAASAQVMAEYYRREAAYWKGLAIGDKAQAVYASAVQSIENGGGFAMQTTPSAAYKYQ